MGETDGKQGVGRDLVERGTPFLVSFVADNEQRNGPEMWPMVEPTVLPLGTHI